MLSNIPILDPNAFSVLLQICEDNDLSPVIAIVDQFLIDLGPLMARLTEAERAGDFAVMGAIAHSLKGSSATFGLMQVETAADNLERAATNSDAAGVAEWVLTLRNVISPGCVVLREYLGAL